jgi:hypothetical protein
MHSSIGEKNISESCKKSVTNGLLTMKKSDYYRHTLFFNPLSIMNAVYIPEWVDYTPKAGEVVIRTRNVPNAQRNSASKVIEALGSVFGPYSFVTPEIPKN